METQTSGNKSLHPLVWVAGIVFILFSLAGIGAFMGWTPSSMANPDATTIPEPQTAAIAAPAKATATQRKSRVQVADSTPTRSRSCSECGVIESVREIETKGQGSGLGAVGGGVVGGLLGNQVGGGHGKDAMTVVGAVGGAFAGNEIEKRTKSTKSYAITVRLDNGSSRVVNEADEPRWRSGDKVKIVNGLIQFNS